MKRTILFSIILAFALVSCKKEVTKVVHEDAPEDTWGIVWEIQPEDWAADEDSTMLYASLDIPELTDAILDHGAVMVYLSFVDGEYEAIPQVFDYVSYRSVNYKGGTDIIMRDIDGYFPPKPKGEIWAKVVLIDAVKLSKHPDVNLLNYEEVKRMFRQD